MNIAGLFGSAKNLFSKADSYMDLGKEFINKTEEKFNTKNLNQQTKKTAIQEEEPIGIDHDINVHTDEKTSNTLIILVAIIAMAFILKGKLKM
jgi:hypothetical protein